MEANARPTSEGGFSKWQIAVAIGAPLAVGLAVGAYYYTRSSSETPSDEANNAKQKQKPEEEPVVQTPAEKAQSSKSKGNKFFKAGRFEQAIKFYTEAIEISPAENKQDLSTFYQNRAAAQEQLKLYKNVIEDCSNALELNPKYVKALFRRAKAYENVEEKMKCLEDTTAVCILEGFGHQQGMFLADKMLKELGKERASQTYKERKPTLPSGQFIRSYFSSFSNDGITSNSDTYTTEQQQSDSGFIRAVQSFQKGEYTEIINLCTEEIDTEGEYIPQALLMRASFLLLKGQAADAKPDLDRLIGMEDSDKKLRANALIKRGSMHMQEGNALDAMDVFATAVRIDPDNADIYHHRGQLNLLLEKVDEAVKDFEKCQSLNPNFGLAYAQYCYARYRLAIIHQSPMQMQEALRQLEDCTKKFPACAEGFALLAQALNDQGQFQRADDNFQKAIAIEPDNPTAHVHRGLLQLAWKKDPALAVEMINKALQIDDRCDFAYETLGTIEVQRRELAGRAEEGTKMVLKATQLTYTASQRGNLTAAQGYFDKAIMLARTEIEMAHLYSLSIAAEAQDKVTQKYAITPPKQPFM